MDVLIVNTITRDIWLVIFLGLMAGAVRVALGNSIEEAAPFWSEVGRRSLIGMFWTVLVYLVAILVPVDNMIEGVPPGYFEAIVVGIMLIGAIWADEALQMVKRLMLRIVNLTQRK